MLLALVCGASLLLQVIAAGPFVNNQNKVQVVRYDLDTDNLPNSYKFHYDASDGSSRTEEGGIQNLGTNDAALDVHGAVRWYNSKGQLYEMIYKAGKRGYRTIIKKVS
ncbi:larval cuticle protein 65Ab1 [Bombyx mori]|uniref:Cuticle protein n=1 Tax=Bombyx mori TaxID=7091 RepID=A0A8R2M5R3_BOMMO|nr:larval cuticle protein 65Ab1-like [Bombyx mori]